MLEACFYVKDAQGRYQFVNQSLAAVFGLPADQVIDTARSMVDDTDRQALRGENVDIDEPGFLFSRPMPARAATEFLRQPH